MENDLELFGKPGHPVMSRDTRHGGYIKDWASPLYSYRLDDLRVSSENKYSSPQEAASALEQRIQRLFDQLAKDIALPTRT